MPKRKNPNKPAAGYLRICVDLHRSLVRFLDQKAKEIAIKHDHRVTRSDVIREGLLRFKNGQL